MMKSINSAIALLALLLGYNAGLQAQGTPLVPPNIPFYDSSTGVAIPCVGCLLFSYGAGSASPLATYTDHTLGTANSNPIVLDSSGYNSAGMGSTGVWLGLACYKFELQNAAGVTLWTIDFVCSTSFGGGGGGSLTPPVVLSGTSTSPILTITQLGSGNALVVNGAAIFGTSETITILLSQTLGGPHDWYMSLQSNNVMGFYDSSNLLRMYLNANQSGGNGVFLQAPSIRTQPTVGTQESLVASAAASGQTADIFDVVASLGGAKYLGVNASGNVVGLHGQNVGPADNPAFATITASGLAQASGFVGTAIPTSCTSQPSGTIWNNAGVANVCP